MSEETIKALAEATKASAELGSKVVDAGSFMKGPFSEIAGTWEDQLKAWRLRRRVRLVKQMQSFLEAEGVTGLPRELAPSFLVPALERGEMQEDDDLQDIYAQLLANAANPNIEMEPRAAYVEILSQMTAFDAGNLQTLCEALKRENVGNAPMTWISTFSLPAEAHLYTEPRDFPDMPRPVAISISNLSRLGLIEETSSTFGGKPLFQYVSITPLGLDFYRACSKPIALEQ